MSQKVAIITGGASGFGHAVATKLASTGTWTIIILDINEEAGKATAASIPSTLFIPTDVNNYTSLSAAFQQVFTTHKQLDFVYANAGIVERDSFYAIHDDTSDPTSPPPPPPNLLSLEIDLLSVVHTTWLAQHYFRLNTLRPGGALIMTASVGGLYALPLLPLYCAAKHGVIGFMRSVARPFWERDRVRVNAVCPGTVRTGLLPKEAWDKMPVEFTPIENVVEGVVDLLEGGDEMWGKALEVSGKEGRWFREQMEYRDPDMKVLIDQTKFEKKSD